jgi:SAM-dependent methyltransferase
VSDRAAGPGHRTNQVEHHDYWNSFYAGRSSADVPEEPSPFARWAATRLPTGERVVEFGFGTARDSLWFATRGHDVRGYDFAESAVAAGRGRATRRGLTARFAVLDLYDRRAVEDVTAELADLPGVSHVYGRFLIHSLEDHGRAHLFDLAATVLAGGGELLLEFRTGKDKGAEHVFGDDHFRVYLDPTRVTDEIVARGGRVVHDEQGHGLAVYRTEDPHVARLVARWSD